MKNGVSGNIPPSSSVSTDENKLDRRGFLIKAGKIIIPTIGILGLSLTGFSVRPATADCDSICTGGCQGACTGCTGSCSGTCYWACSDTCKDTCSGNSDKR